MDFVSRLKLYIDHKKLQNSTVADKAGIPRPTLSQLLTGRNKKVSNELIEKLHEAFPDLNMLWLLFGDGDMEVNVNNETSEAQNEGKDENLGSQIADNNSTYVEQSSSNDVTAENSQKNEPGLWLSVSPNETPTAPSGRRVQSIMVFYSDNSYEVFEPARKFTEEN